MKNAMAYTEYPPSLQLTYSFQIMSKIYQFLQLILLLNLEITELSIQLLTTAQKINFSVKDFFSKCDQIRRKLKNVLMENFIFVQCIRPRETIDVVVMDIYRIFLWQFTLLHTTVSFPGCDKAFFWHAMGNTQFYYRSFISLSLMSQLIVVIFSGILSTVSSINWFIPEGYFHGDSFIFNKYFS